MFDAVHHVQLAMPRGAEAAARGFFVDVLGMTEVDKPPVLVGQRRFGLTVTTATAP